MASSSTTSILRQPSVGHACCLVDTLRTKSWLHLAQISTSEDFSRSTCPAGHRAAIDTNSDRCVGLHGKARSPHPIQRMGALNGEVLFLPNSWFTCQQSFHASKSYSAMFICNHLRGESKGQHGAGTWC